MYGINDDERAASKDLFWDKASEIIDSLEGNTRVLGNLHGRVGVIDEHTQDVLGSYGEEIKNDNGELKSRGERSIIDYVLVNRSSRQCIKDVRVKRGAEIYSDHYLVVARTSLGVRQESITKETKKISKAYYTPTIEVIRSHKLADKETANKFENYVKNYLTEHAEHDCDLDQSWQIPKEALLNGGKHACGITRNNRSKKCTNWWNNEIKAEVKSKKIAWKNYLRNGTADNYQIYKLQRIKVKDMVLAAKRKSWEEFGNKMEKDYHSNEKLFFKTLKNLRTEKAQQTPEQIRDKEGHLLHDNDHILDRWKQYFEDLLNIQNDVDIITEEPEEVEQEDQIQDEITMAETKEIIQKLKKGKAAGFDKITAEMLKNMGDKGIELLTKLCNRAWIYERILEKRLLQEVDSKMEQSQSGFRKGRSIQDHIFTIKKLIQNARNSSTKLYQAFIDLEKTFDSIPRKVIDICLKKKVVKIKLRQAIMSIYRHTRNRIRTDNMESEEFIVNEGLRQGGVLGPILFNIVLDDIIKETRAETLKLYTVHRNLEAMWISECAYADDLVIFGINEEAFNRNLQVWNAALIKRNLRINNDKTKVMVCGKNRKQRR
ncbi:uncharacterized protein [Diabrotica undecimpunctata]|uniref:uncharacterized protein n=1 Tax=Diabrotica undecimpunctata TaxID=50387 RepID=UPI003B631A9F